MPEQLEELCTTLAIPKEHHDWFKDYVTKSTRTDDFEEEVDVILTYNENSLTLQNNEAKQFNVTALLQMLSAYLQEMAPTKYFAFTSAYYGEDYGGVAYLVTAEKTITKTTDNVLTQMIGRRNKEHQL